MSIPEEMLKRTFIVEHNPNCPKPFLVRLPSQYGRIDKLPYEETGDILGFGNTLEIAFDNARKNSINS